MNQTRLPGRDRDRRRVGSLIQVAALAAALAACAGQVGGTATVGSREPSHQPRAGGASPPATTPRPDWYSIELIDVRTGDPFSIEAFAGKIVLIETMAIWCPTCLEQQAEVRAARELLGAPEDLILVSLDVDPHEDEASLLEYATDHDLDWRVAVAPIGVARALGNLYGAQYLNPPLSPMLLIDRDGTAVQLPYGVKPAEVLQEILEPYLAA